MGYWWNLALLARLATADQRAVARSVLGPRIRASRLTAGPKDDDGADIASTGGTSERRRCVGHLLLISTGPRSWKALDLMRWGRFDSSLTCLWRTPALSEQNKLLSFISRRNIERGTRVKEVPFGETTMKRRFAVSYRSDTYLSPAAQRFVDLLQARSQALFREEWSSVVFSEDRTANGWSRIVIREHVREPSADDREALVKLARFAAKR
jgi:DNA-binding transcriptional LysR family regulator